VIDMRAQARIPVEFYYDDEALNWHFQAKAGEIGIVGGGQTTLEEARQAAAEAIAFALEGRAPEATDDAQVEYLDVAVG
jgi:hypothetical protein